MEIFNCSTIIHLTSIKFKSGFLRLPLNSWCYNTRKCDIILGSGKIKRQQATHEVTRSTSGLIANFTVAQVAFNISLNAFKLPCKIRKIKISNMKIKLIMGSFSISVFADRTTSACESTNFRCNLWMTRTTIVNWHLVSIPPCIQLLRIHMYMEWLMTAPHQLISPSCCGKVKNKTFKLLNFT